MPFVFLQGSNSGETGIYALTTAFPHPHRLRNENSERKITQRHTEEYFFRSSGIPIQRKQDRPKATWRITVEKEIKALGLTG